LPGNWAADATDTAIAAEAEKRRAAPSPTGAAEGAPASACAPAGEQQARIAPGATGPVQCGAVPALHVITAGAAIAAVAEEEPAVTPGTALCTIETPAPAGTTGAGEQAAVAAGATGSVDELPISTSPANPTAGAE
jgi:hypothetical protein